MTTPDNPSKSELFGQFPTLSARLDNLDTQVGYRVSKVIGYPAEDIGWDVENDPAPFVGEWWGSWYYENTFVLLTDQQNFTSGIYQFVGNPDTDPLTFVARTQDLARGAQIVSYESSVYGKPGVYEIVQDGSYEGVRPKWMGDLSVLTVYTSHINTNSPALDSHGDPLLDRTGGSPVPVLLTGQNYEWNNGIYFACENRLTFSTALTWNGYDGGSIRITTSLFAENGDLDNTGWFWINDPSLGHPALWRQM